MNNMNFEKVVSIITKYGIEKDTAENIAQDILCYHPCGDCAYYGDCKNNPDECEYSDSYKKESKSNPTVLADMRYIYYEEATPPFVDIIGIDFDGTEYSICTMTMVGIQEKDSESLYKCCLDTFHDLGYILAEEYKSK